jgi:HSP20 family molecular chaperone IbpA
MKNKGKGFRKTITFDRALLVAVLAIQAGLAGWFYHYSAQQRTPTHKPAPVLSAPPRPVISSFMDPASLLPNGRDLLTQHPSGAPWVPLSSFPFDDMAHAMRVRAAMNSARLVEEMHQQMEHNMRAFQQMHKTLMQDDAWQDIGTSPTIDMREYKDRYEVTFCIPNAEKANVVTCMEEGGLLSVQVEHNQSDPRHNIRQQFQSRVMLPWALTNASDITTRFENGSLVVSIPR